jgi:hypothetical protein
LFEAHVAGVAHVKDIFQGVGYSRICMPAGEPSVSVVVPFGCWTVIVCNELRVAGLGRERELAVEHGQRAGVRVPGELSAPICRSSRPWPDSDGLRLVIVAV